MSPVSRPIFDWSDESPEDADDGVRDDEGDEDAEADVADPDPDPAAHDGEDALLDQEFPLGDGVAADAATVWCPYCGEASEVALDPGGGAHQAYVEDCPVCCRPWRVTVSYQPDGSADVWAQTDDE